MPLLHQMVFSLWMIWQNLPNETFDIILADPPWGYHGQQDKWGAAAKFYDTATDDDILELPVADLLNPKGILFMWATSPRLDFAMQCLHHWGLHYRGMSFVWVKTKKDGVTPIGAQGVRPSIVKPTVEYVMAASRVAKGRPMKLHNEGIPNVVLGPRREHSRKPEIVHTHIEKMYPDATKLEMFAREGKPGWSIYGNQTDKFDEENG